MRKTILLVDDDAAVRDGIANVLIGEGYEVTTAANGVEAIELAQRYSMDLVLLDLNLPRKNGWDTFETLSRQKPWVPFIIITARPNQLFSALAAGAGALLEKPLDYPKLLQTIRDLLEEPLETRIARLAGKPAEFHYLPSHVVAGPIEIKRQI
jgi:CheY-like chemotaxis protein